MLVDIDAAPRDAAKPDTLAPLRLSHGDDHAVLAEMTHSARIACSVRTGKGN
ncbi:hypothetical protein [Sinorhizobium fredii]|uniref:hypothetical protein n=1 Tax=Rhizobium fredii TaxID=380 RepID=UPI00210A4DC2|nr:hypothetical protein [Sinorhizobium fredii]